MDVFDWHMGINKYIEDFPMQPKPGQEYPAMESSYM